MRKNLGYSFDVKCFNLSIHDVFRAFGARQVHDFTTIMRLYFCSSQSIIIVSGCTRSLRTESYYWDHAGHPVAGCPTHKVSEWRVLYIDQIEFVLRKPARCGDNSITCRHCGQAIARSTWLSWKVHCEIQKIQLKARILHEIKVFSMLRFSITHKVNHSLRTMQECK